MVIDKRKLFVQILAVIGFALSVKLAMIYYTANYDKYALSSFCSINDFIDCDGAAKSTVSQFLGIPLAYWGMLFYLLTLLLTFVDKLKNIKFLKFLEVFKNPMAYITVIGTFAFLVSMSLAGISIWKIKKLCILCVVTYFIDFLIALIPPLNIKDYINSFKITFFDFIDGVKNYPKTFVVLLLLSVSFLTYSEITDCFIPHMKKAKEIKKFMQMRENPYRIKGNLLGSENADVIVELYSDFGCPICYIHNIMLHKVVQQYKNVKVIHYNMPFDKECNYELSMTMHPGGCYMAKAAIAAGKQGDYWGMSSLLYENHPMNEEELIPLIEKLGLDKDKLLRDMDSNETDKKIQEDLKKSYELGLDATPTTFVNGEKRLGIMSLTDMEKLLEDHGAKRKE